MKKFEFRLQRVMEVKEEIEKQKERDFSLARKKVIEEENKLTAIKKQYESCWKDIEDKTSRETVDTTEIRQYYQYLQKLEGDIERQFIYLQEANAEMERRRHILIEASKERKILENLKDRKLASYNEEMNRIEQNFFDEIAGNQYHREQRAKS